MIGGTDVIFWVRDDIPAADIIFRTARRHWPDYVFQDADDPEPITPNPGRWLPEPSGPEFFIYKDEAAALSWDEHGSTPENDDAMLHVILGDRRRPELGLRSLTMVSGELTGEVEAIINELRVAFRVASESLRWPENPAEAA